MKIRILILFLVLSGLSVRAQFTFTTNNNAITITGYTGASSSVTNLVFPAAINGYPVTTVMNNAFVGCVNLTNVMLSASITNVGLETFNSCSSLTNIAVDAASSYYSSTGGVLFNKAQTVLIEFPCGLGGSYIIPGSVTNIVEEAFAFCQKLTNSTITGSVVDIGYGAFFDCVNLTNITMGNGIITIETEAFASCPALTSIAIPASVTNIEAAAFFSCAGLTNIVVNTANSYYSSLNGVLFNKAQTTLVEFPGGLSGSYIISGSITNIAHQAFESSAKLASVTIPASITNIEVLAFYLCSSLTNIEVNAANSYYSSLNGVLFNKTQTVLIEFPYARSGDYTVPGGVTSIAQEAFMQCPNLTSVIISDSVTNIGVEAFWNCGFMGSVVIGSGVTGIGDEAFEYCYALTNVTFFGKAPVSGVDAFANLDYSGNDTTVYYYSNTSGWGATYDGLPTVELNPAQIANKASLESNGNFGFSVASVNGQTVYIESSTNLANWQLIQAITLSGASTNFTDAEWKNYPERFYRVR